MHTLEIKFIINKNIMWPHFGLLRQLTVWWNWPTNKNIFMFYFTALLIALKSVIWSVFKLHTFILLISVHNFMVAQIKKKYKIETPKLCWLCNLVHLLFSSESYCIHENGKIQYSTSKAKGAFSFPRFFHPFCRKFIILCQNCIEQAFSENV